MMLRYGNENIMYSIVHVSSCTDVHHVLNNSFVLIITTKNKKEQADYVLSTHSNVCIV